MVIRPSIPFPLPPLKFRTVGFPQYGFKQAVKKCPSPTRAGFDPSIADLSAHTFYFSRTSVQRLRFCFQRPAQRPLAPPRFYCPLASSLIMAASELLSATAGFVICRRFYDQQQFPNLLCQGLIPCRRPYSGGSQGVDNESRAGLGLHPF
jgi:hypothetical protein